MTLHITGGEFSALLHGVAEMDMIDIVALINSKDLYITIKEICKNTYKTTITNDIKKFEE